MMDHTKPAQWFRMYAEFATDPKVQMLSEADQRRYLMLLCLRCSNGYVTLHDEAIAFQLRISDSDWVSTKAALIAKNLILDDNQPTAWDKRQKPSDSSAARVAKHRALHKSDSNGDVTLQKRPVEKEKEKEKEKKHTPAKADVFCFKTALLEAGGNPDLVADWLKVRSKLRATNTKTAFSLFAGQVAKAGYTINQALEVCCARSWKGFDAEWVKDIKPASDPVSLVPRIDTSLESRRAGLQAQADAQYRERKWLDGERRYRAVITIEDGKLVRTKHYEDQGAAA